MRISLVIIIMLLTAPLTRANDLGLFAGTSHNNTSAVNNFVQHSFSILLTGAASLKAVEAICNHAVSQSSDYSAFLCQQAALETAAVVSFTGAQLTNFYDHSDPTEFVLEVSKMLLTGMVPCLSLDSNNCIASMASYMAIKEPLKRMVYYEKLPGPNQKEDVERKKKFMKVYIIWTGVMTGIVNGNLFLLRSGARVQVGPIIREFFVVTTFTVFSMIDYVSSEHYPFESFAKKLMNLAATMSTTLLMTPAITTNQLIALIMVVLVRGDSTSLGLPRLIIISGAYLFWLGTTVVVTHVGANALGQFSKLLSGDWVVNGRAFGTGTFFGAIMGAYLGGITTRRQFGTGIGAILGASIGTRGLARWTCPVCRSDDHTCHSDHTAIASASAEIVAQIMAVIIGSAIAGQLPAPRPDNGYMGKVARSAMALLIGPVVVLLSKLASGNMSTHETM